MLRVEDAIERMLDHIEPVQQIQTLAIEAAVDTILAESITARFDVPGYTNSAMDGYAFFSELGETVTTGTHWTCVGESLAGHPFIGDVEPHQCIRIMTGAKLPEQLNTVVPQEHTSTLDDDSTQPTIQLDKPLRSGANVRLQGEEIKTGGEVYQQGHKLTPVDIGMLASLGVARVKVYRPLKVALFSTGDELILPGQDRQDFQIYDSNRYVLHAILSRLGYEVINLGLIPDDKARIEATFRQAAQVADAIVCSGGVSVGEADYTKQVIQEIGHVDFWKVAMKPGRPFAFGQVDNAWFFGLPGNPVSASVTFLKLALPALRRLSGGRPESGLTLLAQAGEPLKKRPGRTDFQRGFLAIENGVNTVYSSGAQGSGMLSSLVLGNCLICLEEDRGSVEAGEWVTIELLGSPLK